jgi:hypothetical protein
MNIRIVQSVIITTCQNLVSNIIQAKTTLTVPGKTTLAIQQLHRSLQNSLKNKLNYYVQYADFQLVPKGHASHQIGVLQMMLRLEIKIIKAIVGSCTIVLIAIIVVVTIPQPKLASNQGSVKISK